MAQDYLNDFYNRQLAHAGLIGGLQFGLPPKSPDFYGKFVKDNEQDELLLLLLEEDSE